MDLDKKDTQIVAEVLAEKIVNLGEEIKNLQMRVDLIKNSTGFYDTITDRLSVEMNDLEMERETLTTIFQKVYKQLEK